MPYDNTPPHSRHVIVLISFGRGTLLYCTHMQAEDNDWEMFQPTAQWINSHETFIHERSVSRNLAIFHKTVMVKWWFISNEMTSHQELPLDPSPGSARGTPKKMDGILEGRTFQPHFAWAMVVLDTSTAEADNYFCVFGGFWGTYTWGEEKLGHGSWCLSRFKHRTRLLQHWTSKCPRNLTNILCH